MGLNNEIYNLYAKVEIRVVVRQMMYKGEERVRYCHNPMICIKQVIGY